MAEQININRLKSHVLRDKLRKYLENDLQPGDALMPQTALREKFQVGTATLTAALDNLEKEGLVVRHRGRGIFVTDPGSPLIGISGFRHIEIERTLLSYLDREAADGRLRYQLIQWNRNRLSPTPETLAKAGMKGVIVSGVAEEKLLKRMVRAGLKVISVDRMVPVPGVSVVGIDSFRAGSLAAETLLEQGHTRIAYVGFQPWSKVENNYILELDSEQQRAGVQTALLEKGFDPDPALFVRLRQPSVFQTREGEFSATNAFNHLFKNNKPPTALVVFGHQNYSRILESLAHHGLKVPRDLSVVEIDTIERTSISSVGCSFEAILSRSVDLMMNLFSMPKQGPDLHLSVQPDFFDKGTVGSPASQ